MSGMTIMNIQRNSDTFNDMSDDDYLDAIFNEIVDRTPVDTGECQAGWDLSGDTISNDVEYTSFLENGHSGQAPAGMVQVALDIWEADAIVIEA